MEQQIPNHWLSAMVESIDHRLELLNTKVDIMTGQMLTTGYCTSNCEVRKNAVDKRYFLGWGSCFVLASVGIGVVIKFM